MAYRTISPEIALSVNLLEDPCATQEWLHVLIGCVSTIACTASTGMKALGRF